MAPLMPAMSVCILFGEATEKGSKMNSSVKISNKTELNCSPSRLQRGRIDAFALA